VVAIGSNLRPRLVTSTAQGLAAVGRLPFLGVIAHRGSSAGGGTNSAQRLKAVWEAYVIPPDVEAAISEVTDRAILLVDDYADTGWTMTVLSRKLRQLGAKHVFPFALGAVR
jgi:ATP-dependent DNA helicase RecQ